MEQLQSFFTSHYGIFVAVVVLNAILSSASSVLNKLKDKIPEATESKLLNVVAWGLSLTQKVIDFISANQAH